MPAVGHAVASFDKLGVGGSTGSLRTTNSEHQADQSAVGFCIGNCSLSEVPAMAFGVEGFIASVAPEHDFRLGRNDCTLGGCLSVVRVYVVNVDHQHCGRRCGVDRTCESVTLGAGATDHDHAIAELQPCQHSVGVLEARLAAFAEAERTNEKVECCVFVSVREPGIDRWQEHGLSWRCARDVGQETSPFAGQEVGVWRIGGQELVGPQVTQGIKVFGHRCRSPCGRGGMAYTS